MKLFPYLNLLFLPTIIASCGRAEEPPPPDVSHINVPLELVRFDEVIFDLDTTDVAGELERFDREYGAFSDVYLRNIMPVRRADFEPEEQIEVMKAMLRYEPLQRLDSIAAARFDEAAMNDKLEELRQALRYFHYYLPDATLPDTLTSFLSEFGFAALLYGDGDMAVGLEFYLGPDFNYNQVNSQEAIFSEYLSRTYQPEYMSQKLMRVLIEDVVPRPRAGRLIDYLIYEGKKLFLLKRVLPEASPEIILEASPEQVEWLENNETAIYAYLQKEELLYDTNGDKIRKLTQPAPYTQGMPKESPGRAVNYLGLRIVEAFVRANPDVTMPELLDMLDGQRVLAGARFKPK